MACGYKVVGVELPIAMAAGGGLDGLGLAVCAAPDLSHWPEPPMPASA